eukprot:TRINITY_DN2669_c1_g1_i1.p1 TRINITY_DN2669_c1_g1~~TRINITY_DN2669_c1_g1_i1.p1  ORF type:complete len:528 (-),score=14.68 TRINITY_DN2669_c1_g1_i1:157-1614(-)
MLSLSKLRCLHSINKQKHQLKIYSSKNQYNNLRQSDNYIFYSEDMLKQENWNNIQSSNQYEVTCSTTKNVQVPQSIEYEEADAQDLNQTELKQEENDQNKCHVTDNAVINDSIVQQETKINQREFEQLEDENICDTAENVKIEGNVVVDEETSMEHQLNLLQQELQLVKKQITDNVHLQEQFFRESEQRIVEIKKDIYYLESSHTHRQVQYLYPTVEYRTEPGTLTCIKQIQKDTSTLQEELTTIERRLKKSQQSQQKLASRCKNIENGIKNVKKSKGQEINYKVLVEKVSQALIQNIKSQGILKKSNTKSRFSQHSLCKVEVESVEKGHHNQIQIYFNVLSDNYENFYIEVDKNKYGDHLLQNYNQYYNQNQQKQCTCECVELIGYSFQKVVITKKSFKKEECELEIQNPDGYVCNYLYYIHMRMVQKQFQTMKQIYTLQKVLLKVVDQLMSIMSLKTLLHNWDLQQKVDCLIEMGLCNNRPLN